MVFGKCTVPVGQSEQTVLVGRKDFVESEAFERDGHRGPTNVQYLKKNQFF